MRRTAKPDEVSAARVAAGLSQKLAASFVSVSQATWSNWESGKTPAPLAMLRFFQLVTHTHPTHEMVRRDRRVAQVNEAQAED